MSHHHRKIRLLASFAVAALVMAACGSSAKKAPAASSAGGSPTTAAGKAYKWVIVTDVAGLGDQGFNDLAYAGVQQAAQQFGGTASVIQSTEAAQYVPNLQQAVTEGASLIVAVGFALTDSVVQVATQNPNAKFLMIDSVAADKSGAPVPNVRSVTFKEQEASYLAGIVAGLTTKSNKLGFLGGQEIPPVVRFLAGFKAGVTSVNPSATVQTTYIGNFTDSAKGEELTANYFSTGIDVVFESAGLGALGAYKAAKAKGKGYWMVSVDTCKQQLGPDNYLTSATKDVTGEVVKAAQLVATNSFQGVAVNEGLAQNAVGVCQKTFSSLPQKVQDAVTKAESDVKSGAITVPDK